MKYLCLGYLDPAKMDSRPKAEVDAVMKECMPQLKDLYDTGGVIVDAGLELETKCLRRVAGSVSMTDGPFTEAKEIIGSVFILEAPHIEEAIRLASLHPTLRVNAAEQFGWRIEVRGIHYFHSSDSATAA